MNEILGLFLLAVLIPIAAILGRLVARLLKKHIERIDNDVLQGLAWTAVRFVEQKFTKLHGQDKFDKAYERIAKYIKGVEKEDIEEAIEVAVEVLNEGLGKKVSSSISRPKLQEKRD